ncbi:MAG: paraquat-inducible protein A, partial [Myxococcales bacterium]
MSERGLSAAAAGFARCDVCESLVPWRRDMPPDSERCCPRCGSVVRLRRPNSIGRTWALVLSAYVMYVPANLFAMTAISQLGSTERDTILGGVLELLAAG